jgi:hypothetical protein
MSRAAGGSLREPCEQQAAFVLTFRECDPACVRDAREALPRARR